MATKEKEPNEVKFPLEKLRENSIKVFGVTTSTFDGATYGLDGEFTKSEIQKKIENWLKTPIGKGGKK